MNLDGKHYLVQCADTWSTASTVPQGSTPLESFECPLKALASGTMRLLVLSAGFGTLCLCFHYIPYDRLVVEIRCTVARLIY
jgi:hypothetical protein